MKRAWLVAALSLAGCKGLLYDQGNAFPCDFNASEEVRDLACAPEEVCSVLNRCERFVYEGPQFEGTPQLPEFTSGKKVHPQTLDGPITLLNRTATDADERTVAMALPDGGLKAFVTKAGTATVVKVSPLNLANVRQLAVLTAASGALLTSNNNVRFLDNSLVMTGSPARALRAGFDAIAVLRDKGPPKGTALALDINGNTTAFSAQRTDGGTLNVIELRWVPPSRKGVSADGRPVLLTEDGFFLGARDGGSTTLSKPEDAASFGLPFDEPRTSVVSLRHDSTGALWAFGRPKAMGPVTQPFPSVLSTWFLRREGEAPVELVRAWNDCTPCPNGRLFAIAPNLDGLANVEVMCGTTPAQPMTLVRVVGSLSADPDDPCVTAPVKPGFDLSRRTVFDGQPVVMDEANGGGVAIGGAHGEVWVGPSFSLSLPLFLERVPLAIGTFTANGETQPLVVTDRYLAAALPSPGLINGFKAVDFRRASDFVLDNDTGVRALVGGSGGWGVLSTGDLARVSARQGLDAGPVNSLFQLTYGPRLVTARGEPAREPFAGEAVTAADGGVTSLVMAADDSVYLVPSPAEASAPNALPPQFPQLTPEPGSPIRSFALERTRLGTDGVKKVRGYVVTSRNLFTVTLSGEPARWAATPLLLGGGEPLKVWMDNPRGGLARAGYRDGTVFSLPGGFQLVRPVRGEEPRQVLDYENLGGWPVAYATSGLWVGRYDLVDGKLDNKLSDGRPGKPMTWRPVTMPDGSTPWLKDGGARPGKLHVLASPPSRTQPYQQLFRLFLYLDDAVYEVGTMTRTNVSAPPP